jgi:DNA invertase Pin-like site-specific DNA recombinase
MGEVGLVLGLEVSRLARNSSDWHRLLEICALTDTLILDEDGLYNPADFNDRLLLGLKGTMSEAELHVLRARLIGGQLAKASRGELEMKLPVGLVNDAAGACHPRPRPAGAERCPHLLRHLPPHRLGDGYGAQLPGAGPALPPTAEHRTSQG